MVEEWPVAAPAAADPMVERARVSGGGRLRTATLDFFLDPAERLTEQERALMTAMLHGLVGGLADELRVRLPDHIAAAAEIEATDLVAILSRAGLLSDERLVALLLKRADAARISQSASEEAARQLLSRFASDPDEEVAASAMSVALARGRRRDRVRSTIELNDIDQPVAERLVHGIAAALALRSPGSDPLLTEAAANLLARHDHTHGLDAAEARLIAALHAAGRIDAQLVLSFGARGEGALLAHALARLAGVPAAAAWDMLMASGEGQFAMLLRLAGQSRATAAALFVGIGPAVALHDPAAEIDRFDALSDEAVERERRRLQLPPVYREAAQALVTHG